MDMVKSSRLRMEPVAECARRAEAFLNCTCLEESAFLAKLIDLAKASYWNRTLDLSVVGYSVHSTDCSEFYDTLEQAKARFMNLIDYGATEAYIHLAGKDAEGEWFEADGEALYWYNADDESD